jgi:hypothetical protein
LEIGKFLDNLDVDIGPNERQRDIRSDIHIELFQKSCVPPNDEEILTRERVKNASVRLIDSPE